MLYEVQILSSKGDLKKVVSTQELSKTHWNTFKNLQLPNRESLSLLREYKKQISVADYHAGTDTHI
jgi:hypothetical protein